MKQSKDGAREKLDVRTSNQLKKFSRDSEELTPTREVVPTWLDVFDENPYRRDSPNSETSNSGTST